MSKRLSQVEFDIRCREVHGDEFICLDVYKNNSTKLKFQCKKHGIFKRAPSKFLLSEYGCPKCGIESRINESRDSISNLQNHAFLMCGKLISQTYIRQDDKYLWECEFGHQWFSNWNKIKRGQWCPHCYGRYKSIDDLHQLAKLNKGKCLSTEYRNNTTKYLWECEFGHQWRSKSKNIKSGTWCPICAQNNRKNIDHLNVLAKKYNGKCLSSHYVNNKTKYRWQCDKNHIWMATGANITKGHWCPMCAHEKNGNYHRGSIETLELLALKNDGKCLSTEYINNSTKYSWECKHGHQWSAVAGSIQQGRWCPICNESKGERKIKEALDALNIKYIREHRFNDCRGKKKPLPFDFYIPNLNLCIEFDGIQHFYFNKSGWNTKENLKIVQNNDKIKNEYCKNNQIRLIRISYNEILKINLILKKEINNIKL